MKITKITNNSEVEVLLNCSSLPASDIGNNNKLQLFGIYKNNYLIACIGVENYGETALLRSLAVDSKFKNQGIGRQLVVFIEIFCKKNGVKEIFLLTETAEKYFKSFGYNLHKRENAPVSIQNTTQFSTLCPSSSIFMNKILNG